MKTILRTRLCAGIASLALCGPALAKNLAVNHVNQRYTDGNGNVLGDNWCWAASSKMVLDYYGYPQGLTSIVTYGVGNSTYDTWNYLWGTGTESRTGIKVWESSGTPPVWTRNTKTITIGYKGIEAIVKNYSGGDVQTQRYGRSLTADEITKEIDERDAPFFVRIGWHPLPNSGGHFMVCYGTAGGNHAIRDPWFGSYVISDGNLRSSTAVDGTATHTWTHTLTTSKIVDVCFLFDTTGSMGDDIANAKANASSLLDRISTKFKNYRVAVANYKDYPEDPWGDPSDFVYQANQGFTTDKAAAQAAINSLGASGGNDWPESVFTALTKAINGDGIGAWRDNPARRIIILIGDAPGHDPEPWSGGTSFAAVQALANNVAKPIAVHCLLVGTDIDAQNQYASLGSATGGSMVQVNNASQVSLAIQQIVDSVAASSRAPQADVNTVYPNFIFESEGNGGMGPGATSLLLEVQRKNGENWVAHSMFTIKNPNATSYLSTKPFATGDYRWRVGFKRKAGKLRLPNGTVQKVAAATIYEENWTEFERILNVPGAVNLLSPNEFFSPEETTVDFEFSAVPGASSYVLQILQNGDVKKSYKIAPPKGGGSVITKRIGGFKTDQFYQWRVQALNYDRPTVDDDAW